MRSALVAARDAHGLLCLRKQLSQSDTKGLRWRMGQMQSFDSSRCSAYGHSRHIRTYVLAEIYLKY